MKDGAGTLNKEPRPLFEDGQKVCADATSNTIAWIKDCDGNYVTVYPKGQNIKDVQLVDGTYCVKYPITQEGCRQVLVKAMYQPKEFKLILTGNLFAGNSCSIANSSKVGKLVIEIPRFQLDGTVDLGLNMSSVASIALNGFALAYGCGCGDAQYAKVSEVLFDEVIKWAGYTSIYVDPNYVKKGDQPRVYATGPNKIPKRLTFKDFVVRDSAEIDGGEDMLSGVLLTNGASSTAPLYFFGPKSIAENQRCVKGEGAEDQYAYFTATFVKSDSVVDETKLAGDGVKLLGVPQVVVSSKVPTAPEITYDGVAVEWDPTLAAIKKNTVYEIVLEQLATPTNLAITDTTVTWDEVTNATSYDVYVDGALYEKLGC